MLSTPLSLRAVAWSAFLLSAVHAQHVIDVLSFGHRGNTVSPNLRGVPHWWINGDGYVPHIMSDRVVLTPPWPGNAKGGIWSEETLNQGEWSAELSFRASGPERAGGSLQLWYVKDAQKEHGPDSVEQSSRFDGLVVVVDQHGGHGGSIRAFLNDGTISFKDHHDADQLAFGHCYYPYRNLGRLSALKIQQAGGHFEITIDGRPCIATNKVHLPLGYHFGITASSAENPDSFEAHKFEVQTAVADPNHIPPPNQQQQHEQQQHQQPIHHEQAPHGYAQEHNPYYKDKPHLHEIRQELADVLAGSIKNQEDQFADLHNRIQIINHKVNDIYDLLDSISMLMDTRHQDLRDHITPAHDRSDAALRNIEKIERIVMAIQRDLENKDYKDMLNMVHNAIHDTHNSLQHALPVTVSEAMNNNGPKISTLLFLLVVVQVSLFGAWRLWKKRAAAPKKYL